MASYLTGVRLPQDIERGVIGGPRFNTTVLQLDSGFEQRNANWSQVRGEWDAGYGLLNKFKENALDKTELDELINFFYIVQGRAFSWRFRDWSDYEIAFENGTPQTPQFIGLGDDVTTTFQVFKRYAFGNEIYFRVITKLVEDTVEVFLDGVQQTLTTDYTVDADRGLIEFVTAPASTGGTGPGGEEVVSIRCEYDVHARLDTDTLRVNMEIFRVGSWPNIPIVEVRGTGL